MKSEEQIAIETGSEVIETNEFMMLVDQETSKLRSECQITVNQQDKQLQLIKKEQEKI